MIDDLNDSHAMLRQLAHRVRRLENATPLQDASITRGRLRIASVEGLQVEGSQRVSGVLIVSGEEIVNGILTVTGVLIVSGSSQFTGSTQFTGPTLQTGTFVIDGNTTITGQVAISGDMRLTGDLDVDPGGRIRVNGTNPITLDQDGGGRARVRFNGGEIVGDAGGIAIYTQATSGVNVYITNDGVRMASLPTISGVAPNVHMDPAGNLKRII